MNALVNSNLRRGHKDKIKTWASWDESMSLRGKPWGQINMIQKKKKEWKEERKKKQKTGSVHDTCPSLPLKISNRVVIISPSFPNLNKFLDLHKKKKKKSNQNYELHHHYKTEQCIYMGLGTTKQMLRSWSIAFLKHPSYSITDLN